MTDNTKMLFNIQRFQILSRFVDTEEGRSFSAAYAFAWDEGVYPISNHGGDWHEPYKGAFRVPESAMDELAEFLDQKWLAKEAITFYQLESNFDPRRRYDGAFPWDRMELAHACKYMKLAGMFGDEFWTTLAGGHDCPMEAHTILRDYTRGDTYFE